jgi:hypothetical protein
MSDGLKIKTAADLFSRSTHIDRRSMNPAARTSASSLRLPSALRLRLEESSVSKTVESRLLPPYVFFDEEHRAVLFRRASRSFLARGVLLLHRLVDGILTPCRTPTSPTQVC